MKNFGKYKRTQVMPCDVCGAALDWPCDESGAYPFPVHCDPCEKAVSKAQTEYHHRNFGAPTQRSEQQKKREPF